MPEISQERYDELLEQENWLLCLESAGVDNWTGIDFAYELQREGEDE